MDDKKQRRVGVITWISYFNFGTYLQAYALQTVVRSLGYACSIVSDEKMVRALRKESCWLRKVVSKIYHFLKRDDVCFIYGMRQIEAAYASFKSSYLSVDDDWNSSMDLDQRYDIYVCGFGRQFYLNKIIIMRDLRKRKRWPMRQALGNGIVRKNGANG